MLESKKILCTGIMDNNEELQKRLEALENRLHIGLGHERKTTKKELRAIKNTVIQFIALVIASIGLSHAWFELTIDKRREISENFFKEVVTNSAAPLATGVVSAIILYIGHDKGDKDEDE